MINFLFKESTAPTATVLIRFIVGYVFFVEGVQKFIFPDTMGVGHFMKIGIPDPQFMAPLSGGTEIICGTLLMIGLLTRLSTLPLMINISVAIISTKIPVLMNKGFWPAIHESRLDFTMLVGLIFLLLVGAGTASIDAKIAENKR